MKKLHRLIVTSRTYRQASAVTAAATHADPDNRLLSYFPRLRLDAEMIRDSLLRSSGLLCNQIGGPPVRPPQPDGVTEVAFGSPKWKPSVGEDRYRRSVYTMIKRTAPFAMYSIFDAPTGEKCLAERNRSNSPLQALTLLNDEMVLEFSRAAGRMAAKPGSTELEGRLSDLFREILTRPPEKEELDLLSEFWQQQFDRYRADPQAARSLLGIEERAPDEAQADNSPPVEALEASADDQDSAAAGLEQSQPPEQSVAGDLAKRAAWTSVARAIYGLDEAQTRP